MDSVSREEIEAVARETFGTGARVEGAARMTSVVRDGIVQQAGGSHNLPYAVKLAGVPGRLVFRFHRGFGDDHYEHEARCYALLAERTGVRVPRIHAIDRSRRLVGTSYMVMEYMEGVPWRTLTHPRNPALPEAEKESIQEQTGLFYAQVHAIRRTVGEGEREVDRIRYMFGRLENAVREGHFPDSPDRVEVCVQAAEGEPRFRSRNASLCLVDTEVFFRREAGRWELAFVLDPEWMEYRDPYSDLVSILTGEAELWELSEPLVPDAASAARLPFFRGYERLRPVDYEELVRLPEFYQLGLWGNLLHLGSPQKREWIRAAKGALIRELIDRVGRRGVRCGSR